MDQIQVAKVYASALLEIASEKKILESMEEELRGVADALHSDEQVWTFLISPRVEKNTKIKAVESAFRGKVSDTIASLLDLLIKRDRMFAIKEISNQFSFGHDLLKGRIRAFMTSAQKLSDSEIKDIKDILTASFKGECILETKVNPEIIGGFIIRLKDIVIDGSMKHQLQKMKQNLLQSKLQSGAFYEN